MARPTMKGNIFLLIAMEKEIAGAIYSNGYYP